MTFIEPAAHRRTIGRAFSPIVDVVELRVMLIVFGSCPMVSSIIESWASQ